MKVLLLLGRSTGGIGTQAAELARELRALGVEVLVVTDEATAARFDLGPSVRRWWPASPRGAGRALPDLLRLRAAMARADLVHAHGHQVGVFACALAGRTPVVVTWHNPAPPGPVPARAARFVARRADAVTGASSDLVEAARRDGAAQAWLSPVPSPKVAALLAQPRDIPEVPMVLTVSRIAPQKELGVLVAAAARLSAPAPPWTVVGDGVPQLRAELEATARHTGVPVRFVGADADVAGWLRRASVFVLTSRWEARALVVQEAMAAGVPVVATDVGGLRDLVAGHGLLVPPGDAAAVAAAVDRVLGDPGLAARLSAGGREAARSWPDGRDTARNWLRWYERLAPMT
ncbi:MAG TPA: glycosyltransferase family 4 protein [Dermatophilaceae bacterium]|nr:glycosyltransferase family 4 protein [Dermatophilaceae bacterium]